jgi:hypothetical protein
MKEGSSKSNNAAKSKNAQKLNNLHTRYSYYVYWSLLALLLNQIPFHHCLYITHSDQECLLATSTFTATAGLMFTIFQVISSFQPARTQL